MNRIKLFLVAAAVAASPAMAGENGAVAYGNGWWDGWMAADVMYRVNGTASATGKFVGDVGKGAVETAANVGEGSVHVVGEVAETVLFDIPKVAIEFFYGSYEETIHWFSWPS